MSGSDVESIISEEVDVASNDGSEVYNPTEDQYDEYDQDAVITQPKLQPILPQKTIAASLSNFKAVSDKSKDAREADAVESLNEPTADYSNSYEDEFEPDFEPENEAYDEDGVSAGYSNDFEAELTSSFVKEKSLRILSSTGLITTLNASAAQTVPATTQPLKFPSLDIQAAQAELALDEISKEVLRLRSRQQNLLRERRKIAKEKKQRAEERRLLYQSQYQELSDRAVTAQSLVSTLKNEILLSERKLDACNQSNELLQESLKTAEVESKTSQDRITALTARLSAAEAEIAAMANRAKQQVIETAAKVAELSSQVQRAELLASVLQKSTEAAEARMIRERDRLPDHHQQLLDEALQRVGARESLVMEREGLLRAEEARRIAAVDQLRKELLDESASARHRLEAELAEARLDLQARARQVEADRSRLMSAVAAERAALDTRLLEAQRHEAALSDARNELLRQRTALEVGQGMMEPHLRAAEADREDARHIKSQADAALLAAEQKTSTVLAAERGLIVRERELQEQVALAETMLKKIDDDRRSVAVDISRQRAEKQLIDAERFQLHLAALEMIKQVGEIKAAMRLLTKYSGGRKGPELMAGVDGLDRRIVNATSDGERFNQTAGHERNERLVDGGASTGMGLRSERVSSLRAVPAHLDPAMIQTVYSLDSVVVALTGLAERLESARPVEYQQQQQHQHHHQQIGKQYASQTVAYHDAALPYASSDESQRFRPGFSTAGYDLHGRTFNSHQQEREDVLLSIVQNSRRRDSTVPSMASARRHVSPDGAHSGSNFTRPTTATSHRGDPLQSTGDEENTLNRETADSIEEVKQSAQALRSAAVKYGVLM